MRTIGLWILGAIVAWPIQFNVGWVSERPVNLVSSDFLFVIAPVLAVWGSMRTRPTVQKSELQADVLTEYLALTLIAYVLILATVGFGASGEIERVFSAIRFAMPIGFVFLGFTIGSSLTPMEVIHSVARAHGVVIGITLLSGLLGSTNRLDEWGKLIFGFEITGYPNGAMTLFAMMVPLLLSVADASGRRFHQILNRFLAVCSALFVIISMSRSSALTLFVGTFIYLALNRRWKFLAGCAAVFVILASVGLGLVSIRNDRDADFSLQKEPASRFEQTREPFDPSNGRFEIWRFVLEHSSERPMFGYLFERFSHYAGEIEDPHQQYLEILYKCGGFGLFLYLGFIGSCMWRATWLLRSVPRGTEPWYLLCGVTAMLVAILIGSLTQSNLTYPGTGNTMFLLLGCLTCPGAYRTTRF